jgi:branched-chain amino acid transport system ATP-binding protein
MSPILTVTKVTKTFGKLVAVDSASFEVYPNEVFGIAGPNGAGKSTLFNLITRVPYGPDAGAIVYDGSPIHMIAPHAICRRGITRTFQTESVFDTLSVEDNVRIGAVYGAGSPPAGDWKRRVREALAFVDLWDQRERLARDLALLEKKRVMLASALATQPKILLLDEPASGLNRTEQQQTIDLIRKINASGVTIILIEHVLPLLLALSRRVMFLNAGRPLVVGPPDEVMRDERVIEAYLGSRVAHERLARG